jgi:hypothetical protein
MKVLVHSGCPLVLTGDARGVSISCLEGDLWITQEGDSRDHMILPGQRFVVDRRGRILVSSLREAELAIGGQGRSLLGLRLWRARLVPRRPRVERGVAAPGTRIGRAA